MKTINDIQTALKDGYTNWQDHGFVSIKEKGDLRLFNYNAKAQFEARWNFFEMTSRGLILNAKTGEVVARPFDKFFNWGENNRYSNAQIANILEKEDGSLGILYRYKGNYHIATRGSFDGPQALWATKYLNENYNLENLSESYTLLFEIIYPDNRIVVDYYGKSDLVLLACRNRMTGKYVSVKRIANEVGFSLPKVYDFKDTDQIISALKSLDANSEGWVVEFADGQRFKFKGEKYLELHKLISGLSFKNTLKCVENGTLDELRAIVPDEFMGEVNTWIEEIQDRVNEIQKQVDIVFELAPKETRKDFAIWVMANHKSLAGYLFAKLDGKPIKPLIYKSGFKDY